MKPSLSPMSETAQYLLGRYYSFFDYSGLPHILGSIVMNPAERQVGVPVNSGTSMLVYSPVSFLKE